MSTSTEDLIVIKDLLNSGNDDNIPKAIELIFHYLETDMDNPRLLWMAGTAHHRLKLWGVAYQFFVRAKELAPHRPEIYNSIGLVYQNMHNWNKAERFFLKALDKYPKDHPDSSPVMNNLGLLYVNQCKFDKALEWSEKCLELNPNMLEARESKSLANLAKGNWREGWIDYESMLGIHKQRMERTYCSPEEPRWDGSPGKVVVVYGEQGLGDEIYFSSLIPDALKTCRQLVVDCDYRLEGLFRRSFPNAHVHGTRFDKHVKWGKKYAIDARCSIGTLPKFYRNEDSDFPGKPWLKTDPERVIQWTSLLNSLGKGPKIGFAWTGGNQHTGMERRSVTLDMLVPIMKSVPCGTFVSLQYKGNTEEEIEQLKDKHGITMHHWNRATLRGCLVDDTAALIDSLDLVVSVTTTTAHLSGAIGKKAFVLVPAHPRWLYALNKKHMPWYGETVELFRQVGTVWPIEDVKNAVVKYFSNSKVEDFDPALWGHNKCEGAHI